MLKLTASKTRLNKGLALGAIIGAAVPVAMWIGLGGAVSGLFAGNVEVKSPVERVLDAEAKKAGEEDG